MEKGPSEAAPVGDGLGTPGVQRVWGHSWAAACGGVWRRRGQRAG